MENLKQWNKASPALSKYLIFSFCFLVLLACNSNNNPTKTEKQSIAIKPFKFWVWTTVNSESSDQDLNEEFERYSKNGIDAVLVNTNADAQLLARLVPFAKKHELEIHGWMFTVNRPNDPIAEQNPEWYAVSWEGKSCYDEPPYVGYYKWLCPTRTASRNHILNLVEGLAKVEGVASVHLDYIRYSDIFLPIGLLPKYNLEQNHEKPEFDFCYCDVCLEEFEKMHHKNPKDFTNPAIDMEWKNFRLNKVKAIVDDAYEIAHANNKNLTAAVFPYPEMADHMVRQRWDKWSVDAVLPMIYHNFYNEEIDWIGYATKQGYEDLKGKNTELHTGVYVPSMNEKDLKTAIELARDNGASGVSFFDGNAITPQQWNVIGNYQK